MKNVLLPFGVLNAVLLLNAVSFPHTILHKQGITTSFSAIHRDDC